jgi:uncharacterized metal-binding protein
MPTGNDTPNGETLIFTCAGAAHCGQVANSAALQLTRDGAGKIFCLAAMSAGIPDKMQRAREAAIRIVIDGCDDRCARVTMEKAGLPVDAHLVVTDHGIEKMPAQPRITADATHISQTVCAQLTGLGFGKD